MTDIPRVVIASPIGLEGIISRYGDCRHVVPGSPSEVAWKQLILKYIPLPSPLTLPNGQQQTRMGVHKDVADELSEILAEVWPHVKSAGCYAFRKSRTSEKLSTHAWAIAVDLNAETNQLGSVGDMHPDVIKAFEDRDWTWGGRWSRRDPMHWQKAKNY